MGRNIVEAAAFAFGSIAGCLLASWSQIVVVLEFVVAKTFGFRTHHLAVLSSLVAPRQVETVFGLFGNGETDGLTDVHLLELLRSYIHPKKYYNHGISHTFAHLHVDGYSAVLVCLYLARLASFCLVLFSVPAFDPS